MGAGLRSSGLHKDSHSLRANDNDNNTSSNMYVYIYIYIYIYTFYDRGDPVSKGRPSRLGLV